jgi:oligopeptide/dipeptide ABC transporter ATP-binding protein
VVAIVGESGSGKSVGARAVMGLVPRPPGNIPHGRILFDGRDLLTLDAEAMRRVRGDRIAMIFQEPMTSLNPVITIGRQMTEAMVANLGYSRRQARERAVELLGMVGISEPARRMKQYPHLLSGGMRQRVMIAMALSCEPELIIADEPTTALDVTIQAQILTIMEDLCRRMGVALIIITHNLGIVARYAHRVNVMYAGRIVEQGTAAEIYHRPRHPYTAGLLTSVPRMDRSRSDPLLPIPGNPPDLIRMPPGCAFRPRCKYATDECTTRPPLAENEPGHAAACWNSAALIRDMAA